MPISPNQVEEIDKIGKLIDFELIKLGPNGGDIELDLPDSDLSLVVCDVLEDLYRSKNWKNVSIATIDAKPNVLIIAIC